MAVFKGILEDVVLDETFVPDGIPNDSGLPLPSTFDILEAPTMGSETMGSETEVAVADGALFCDGIPAVSKLSLP